MNVQVPALKPQLQSGARVAAMVPATLDEAFRLSQAIAISGLAPRDLNTPEKVMVAVMAGAELGLPPFQALQSFAVVNGRPTIWGDGLMAVVRSHGVKVREWIDGDSDSMVARCEATRPDGEVIAGEFSVADAKKAGLWGKQGPWQQYPKRMLRMRARAFTLRDGCADMLRGIQVREEVEDYGTVEEVRTTPAETLRIESAAAPAEIEIVPVPDAEGTHSEAASPAAEEDAEPSADGATAPHASDDFFPGDLPVREG